jgi:hypothetical protein
VWWLCCVCWYVVSCGGCVASVGMLCLVMSYVRRVRVMYLLLSIY